MATIEPTSSLASKANDKSCITMSEVATLVPGRPSLSTIHRWAERGVRGVVLESWFAGSRRFTTVAAVERFLKEQNMSAEDRLAEEGC